MSTSFKPCLGNLQKYILESYEKQIQLQDKREYNLFDKVAHRVPLMVPPCRELLFSMPICVSPDHKSPVLFLTDGIANEYELQLILQYVFAEHH